VYRVNAYMCGTTVTDGNVNSENAVVVLTHKME